MTNIDHAAPAPARAEKRRTLNALEQRANETRARVKRDCRTLYPDGRPGWECGIGWTNAIAKLSYRLECANAFFARNYRVHVEADQVKEKLGRLRFYYTMRRDAPPAVEWLCGLLKKFADATLRTANFRTKRVVVKHASTTIECRELPVSADAWLGSGTILEAPDGFRCALKPVSHFEVAKPVPTRLRPLWHAAYACYKVKSWLLDLYSADLSRQTVGMEALDDFTEKAIAEAEAACYSTCEECGSSIGTDYSPRCKTLGWIAYICERCAKKRGGKYRKGDGIYKDGEFIEAVKKPECGEGGR